MSSTQHTVRVVLRYDDCSALSSLKLEEELIQVFAECGIQGTFGVIPFICSEDVRNHNFQKLLPLPSEKIAVLKKSVYNGHIEIALHGYSHQYWKAGLASEFFGLPASEQERRILEGSKELESQFDISIKTFIPPWNSYDKNTLRILEKLNFSCISASLKKQSFFNDKRCFLPFSCKFQGLQDIVFAAKMLKMLQPVIVVVLHDFDFLESGHKRSWLSICQFREKLKWILSLPYVEVCSLRQACAQNVALSENQLIIAQKWYVLSQDIPWRIRNLLEDQALIPYSNNKINIRNVFFNIYISFYVVFHDFSLALVRKLLRIFNRLWPF